VGHLEALCIAQRTKHVRYCQLCADSHPDSASYRDHVICLAGGTPPDRTPAPTTDREAILRRRAGKPRIKLGAKPPIPEPGRR
jgi:hypothetical protein